VKFGVDIPNMPQYCKPEIASQIAVEAESLNFDSVFVMDHYMWPWTNETWEAWILLSYIAAKTSKIKLGTAVTPLPFRPPGLLAKMAATLDVISNGRLIMGVGAGWVKKEFEAYSTWDEPKTRVEKTEEALNLILKLWTEKKVDFNGKYYTVKGAALEPKPKQKPYPQLWSGGSGNRMLKLTGTFCNGWLPITHQHSPVTVEDYRKKKIKIEHYIKSANRSDKFTYSLMFSPKDTKSASETIENYKNAGCDYFVIEGGPLQPQQYLDLIKEFGKNIIQSFS
jgi:alkanesulfonate monooxygenase SsuD/methylene tetrahydromethanopterin reductase-like flavin-dependent oxidoreductase (luciferase family)